jgi:glycerate kinase
MAAASGLALLEPADRNPLNTTTFGTGELIVAAVELGAKHILLGIGGSATCDGGVGCAQACGHTIVLEDGEPVSATEPLVGADLARVVMVKRHRGEKTDRVKITVACDVTNPLFGDNGAAVVFGPQKGASPEQVKQLDDMLRQLASRKNAMDIASIPGAGAAGGLGFGMMAFFGADLRSGIDIVLDAMRLRERLKTADLCLTGEGQLDGQSVSGKAVSGVAKLCGELNVPCVAIGGSVGADFKCDGVTAAFSICDGPMTLEEAKGNAGTLVSRITTNVIRLSTLLISSPEIPTLGDLLDRLGGIPADRVRLYPLPGTATVADVIEIHAREKRLCELVDGVLVEKPLGWKESLFAGAIASAIRAFVRPRKIGFVTGEAGMMQVEPDLVRMPDVAFVSVERLRGVANEAANGTRPCRRGALAEQYCERNAAKAQRILRQRNAARLVHRSGVTNGRRVHFRTILIYDRLDRNTRRRRCHSWIHATVDADLRRVR